jgi:hypothetical protein
MASFDTLNYAKWDSLECSSDDEPQKVRIDPRARGACTIKSDGAKQYSVQMSNGEGPCVVEEDVKNEGFDSDRPFETQLAWQNTPEKTWIQIALPHKAEASASFFDEEVELRIKGMDPVKLPHPSVKKGDCAWALGARPFHGSHKPKKCLALELRKAMKALWPQDTFGGGTSEMLQAGEEIECAWRQGRMLATTPHDDWTGAYTWRQDNERVSVWFDIPEDITSSDVEVNCLPRFLTISVRKRKYQRRLTGVCVPSELVWEFDDDVPDRRRLRVEVVMRDLRSWEDGPFLPEMSRKEAAVKKSAAQ